MKKNEEVMEDIKWTMLEHESLLAENACKSNFAIRINEDKKDIRPEFFKDIDRIIHSQGYTRYIDKTQVYSFTSNDHITHRVLHVQLVSKIARTIGRALRLNEDLIEAIALGHDIGHTPFGHTGERFLNEICKKEKIGYFYHNAQSVRILKDIEDLNISIQTLDGILAHNGELLLNKYEPKAEKTPNDFLNELKLVFEKEDYSKLIRPMTLEACVVRVSDVIAYLGRDFEDAITLGVVKREDLPRTITEVLGNNNSSIVNALTVDIIKHSLNKNSLHFSKEVFRALIDLRNWNYKYIYNSEEATKNRKELSKAFTELFYIYLGELEGNDYRNIIDIPKYVPQSERGILEYVNSRSDEYRKETSAGRMVIDYIAGQTDQFFLRECASNLGKYFA